MIVEDEEKMRQFNQEWDKRYSTGSAKPPIDLGTNADPNAQSLIDSISQSTGHLNVNTGPYVPPPIPTTGNNCRECGLIHPPLPPGQVCPNATAPVNSSAAPQTQVPIQPLTEGATRSNVKDPSTSPPAPKLRHAMAPASTTDAWNPPVQSEPAPLAENNIPTEIHINKYLNSWGELLKVHCTNHNIINVKKLMRHLTVEVTDFLEMYKGK